MNCSFLLQMISSTLCSVRDFLFTTAQQLLPPISTGRCCRKQNNKNVDVFSDSVTLCNFLVLVANISQPGLQLLQIREGKVFFLVEGLWGIFFLVQIGILSSLQNFSAGKSCILNLTCKIKGKLFFNEPHYLVLCGYQWLSLMIEIEPGLLFTYVYNVFYVMFQGKKTGIGTLAE